MKALVVFCAFDQSSIHWGLFANLAFVWLLINGIVYFDDAFTPRSYNTIFAEGLSKLLEFPRGRGY